jgi:hypothetical protein
VPAKYLPEYVGADQRGFLPLSQARFVVLTYRVIINLISNVFAA